MEVALSGMITDSREVQPLNRYGVIEVIPFGMFTEAREEQL